MRQAILSGNFVTNVIVSDSMQLGIPLGDDEACGIGFMYDPEGNPRFLRPPPPAPVWTAYQFLNRFTPQERAGFRAAAVIDPLVADFQMLATAAQEVHADDPTTIAGMSYLVAVGLLTEARKNEVLSGAWNPEI